MPMDLAKLVFDIASAGLPLDVERCKTCTYRTDPQGTGYCYMWAEQPTAHCHQYKANK